MSITNGRDTATSTPPGPTTTHAVARGVLLLLGGVVVILVVAPVGPKSLYWMPLIIGLTYLASSAAGGRSGGLWVPGLIVTAWGVATTTVLSGTIQADFTATTILAIGIGAILATQLPRVGIPCNPLAIAVIVAAIGALELLEAQVGGIFCPGVALGDVPRTRRALGTPAGSHPPVQESPGCLRS